MKVVGVCDDVICTNIRTSTVMGPTNYTPIPSEFLVYLKVSSPVQIDEGAHNPRRVVVLSTQHTCQTPTCPPMRSRTLSKLNTYPIRLIAIFELHHDSPGLIHSAHSSSSSHDGGVDLAEHRVVYEQLSKLVSLEELVLEEKPSINRSSWINFSLRDGMGKLATLERLRHLDISRLQGLKMDADEEGPWICDHWPALETLVAIKFHSDPFVALTLTSSLLGFTLSLSVPLSISAILAQILVFAITYIIKSYVRARCQSISMDP
ncbi:hypothetical protein B0O80DRAFT_500036 [Mortierella sp. GBAus27b]|nr:hypothetical protein B0O80DRAFT_500036 [Mortierella sp. GBAus27b]